MFYGRPFIDAFREVLSEERPPLIFTVRNRKSSYECNLGTSM